MKSSGFILRFIDIGLLLLFGFLYLSDITDVSQIPLPGSDQEQQEQQEPPVQLKVIINSSNEFAVEDGGTNVVSDYTLSVDELEFILETRRDHYEARQQRVAILIVPAGNSMVQSTISVVDVCERLGIPMSIATE